MTDESNDEISDEETDQYWEMIAPLEMCPLCNGIGIHLSSCPTMII